MAFSVTLLLVDVTRCTALITSQHFDFGLLREAVESRKSNILMMAGKESIDFLIYSFLLCVKWTVELSAAAGWRMEDEAPASSLLFTALSQ